MVTSVGAAAVGADLTAIHVEVRASNGLNGDPGVLSVNGYDAQ